MSGETAFYIGNNGDIFIDNRRDIWFITGATHTGTTGETLALEYVGENGFFTGSEISWSLFWTGGTAPYSMMHDGIATPVVTSDLSYSYNTYWEAGFGDYIANYTLTDDVGEYITGQILIQV